MRVYLTPLTCKYLDTFLSGLVLKGFTVSGGLTGDRSVAYEGTNSIFVVDVEVGKTMSKAEPTITVSDLATSIQAMCRERKILWHSMVITHGESHMALPGNIRYPSKPHTPNAFEMLSSEESEEDTDEEEEEEEEEDTDEDDDLNGV